MKVIDLDGDGKPDTSPRTIWATFRALLWNRLPGQIVWIPEPKSASEDFSQLIRIIG